MTTPASIDSIIRAAEHAVRVQSAQRDAARTAAQSTYVPPAGPAQPEAEVTNAPTGATGSVSGG